MNIRGKVRHIVRLERLTVSDDTWITLGQLRSLVAEADDREWPDSSLVSGCTRGEHPTLREYSIVSVLVVEGGTSE